MSLLPIHSALLDLHDVDEDESEAVALCLVELLFAETNAFYRQHCLAKVAMAATAALLTSSVFDAVTASQIQHEASLDPERFVAERSPIPEINDRHAARCLPHRSPEKADEIRDGTDGPSLNSAASVDGSIGISERTRVGLARKRRSPEKRMGSISKPALVTIPQAIALPDDAADQETAEDAAWRIQCMKELSGDLGASSKVGKTPKWSGFTRQTAVVEPRVELEVEIIDSAPPLLCQEVADPASVGAVRMKSSLNTFSSISNASDQRNGSTMTSTSSRQPANGARGPSLTGSQSAPALSAELRKVNTLQLHDNLSRKRSTLSKAPSSSRHGTLNASVDEINPWGFDSCDITPREAARNRFLPDMIVASAATIPTAITLSAGVGVTHGDSTLKGPERGGNDRTMSRKRFELHQRLATDHLIQESALLQQLASPHGHSSSPGSSHSQHHQRQQLSPRPYLTVPPDPVPVPSLSPMAKGALAIPRNHLTQSMSTPSLRVRQSSVLKRSETSIAAALATHPLVTPEELDALRKARPSSALGAVVATMPRQRQRLQGPDKSPQRPKSSSATSQSKRGATTKYLREFPKPSAGTIKLNAPKAVTLDPASVEVDSVRQRMAWIT